MERSTLLRKNLVAIEAWCQHSAICEDADTAIAPRAAVPVADRNCHRFSGSVVFRAHKRRREPNGSRLPSFSYLLLAPVAGGTTVGGIATYCIRRLHRSCKAERDHCHQHHCPDLLHGFSPWKNEMWFLSTVGQCHRRSTRANVGE